MSSETLWDVVNLLNQYIDGWHDAYAFVFLGLKQVGRGEGYHIVENYEFKGIINKAFVNNIPIGFDSCSAHKFLEMYKDDERIEQFKLLAEPCESTCFSIYIDVDGYIWPCSFLQHGKGILSALNMKNVEDFMKQVWYYQWFVSFRKHLINGGRKCPSFKV